MPYSMIFAKKQKRKIKIKFQKTKVTYIFIFGISMYMFICIKQRTTSFKSLFLPRVADFIYLLSPSTTSLIGLHESSIFFQNLKNLFISPYNNKI